MGEILLSQKRCEEAITLYESILTREAHSWTARIGLGWAIYERGDGLATAVDEFQKVIKIPESKGSGEYAIAQILVREKQFEQAEEWYVKALTLNPEARWWWISRANAMRDSGQFLRAIEIYLTIIAKFPNFSHVYYEIARAYKLNQQLAEAILSIYKAIALMEAPNLHYYLRAGKIYEESGEKEKALQFYQMALKIDPVNESALKGLERVSN